MTKHLFTKTPFYQNTFLPKKMKNYKEKRRIPYLVTDPFSGDRVPLRKKIVKMTYRGIECEVPRYYYRSSNGKYEFSTQQTDDDCYRRVRAEYNKKMNTNDTSTAISK
jgi:hypothetical protein